MLMDGMYCRLWRWPRSGIACIAECEILRAREPEAIGAIEAELTTVQAIRSGAADDPDPGSSPVLCAGACASGTGADRRKGRRTDCPVRAT